MLLLSLLIFLSAACAAGGLLLLLTPNRSARQLKALAGADGGQDWGAAVAQVLVPFARLSIPEGDWERSPLRLRFMHAGIRRDRIHLIYFGAKSVLPLVFAGAAFGLLRALTTLEAVTLLMYTLIAALAGCFLPNLVLALLVRWRRREIFEHFPDAADLMLICVEAGLGLDAALTRIAAEMRTSSMALAEELHLTMLEMRAGASRENALRNLALRTGVEELGAFASMLTQSDKFGTSVGDSLRVFSDDLRYKRRIRAEEQAAKVPTKMLIPLVLFIFPSIIMVVLGPAVIVIMRTLMPMLGAA